MEGGNYAQRKKGEKMNTVLRTPSAIVNLLRIAIFCKTVWYIARVAGYIYS